MRPPAFSSATSLTHEPPRYLGVSMNWQLAAFTRVNRPGFGGRSDSTERWSYASTEEVPG
jgi:hypothetical protein